MNEIIAKLKEPFGFKEIEWKIQVTMQEKSRGLAVAYVDSRAIQKRLDEAVGPFCWSNEYQPWQEKSQICKLSIYCADRGEWVTKSDGAENTDYEPVKGGLSDAFKRVASLWGIGRYLYDIEGVWVEIEQKGKRTVIKQNQYKSLESTYNQAVSRLFNVQQFNPAAQRPQSPERQQSPQTTGDYEYRIQLVKPVGKDSCCLLLVSSDGKQVTAYAKNDNGAIKEGAGLRNVRIAEKTKDNKPYNILEAYDLFELAA